MFLFIGILTALLLVVTLLPLSKNVSWWVRVWDFPRLQIAALLVINCILINAFLPLTLASTLFFIVSSGCLLYQLWWILPYMPFWEKEVMSTDATDNNIRLMAANVLTTNKEAGKLLDIIREHKPDVLVTLETDKWWEDQLAVIEPNYPHTVKCPLDNLYGMHVYSKLPLEDAVIRYLVEEDVPSIHAKLVMENGVRVRIHFLHPAPPSPTENEESIERDIELLLLAKDMENCDYPAIMTGDLNDVAWSRSTRLFRKISGLLDPRVGRGFFNTFHADHWLLRWPLDHLFHSSHFTLKHIARLPHFGSDHFPVLIELHYAGAHLEQEGLEADHEDQKDAQEILAQKSEL